MGAVFERIMAGDSGLSKRTGEAFFAEVLTEVAGALSDDLDARITAAAGDVDPRWRGVRAFRMGWYVGREVLARVQPTGPVSLVVATTKAGLDELQAAIATGAAGAGGLCHPSILGEALRQSLGLTGSLTTMASACGSGLAALIHGARQIRTGRAAGVLVIAVDALERFTLAGFSCLRALSVGPSKPFDEDRTGLSLGEGAAAAFLTAGPTDGVGVHVDGWGQAMDANHVTAPSRTGDGLAEAIGGAVAMSGCSTDEIDLINAHGTGTIYNDEMEAQALRCVFGPGPGLGARSAPVVSFKGALGHTLGAAGLIETLLTAEALVAQAVPPTVGFAKLGVTVPLNVSTRSLRGESLTRALTLKSGFGGVNAAAVIRLAPGGGS